MSAWIIFNYYEDQKELWTRVSKVIDKVCMYVNPDAFRAELFARELEEEMDAGELQKKRPKPRDESIPDLIRKRLRREPDLTGLSADDIEVGKGGEEQDLNPKETVKENA